MPPRRIIPERPSMILKLFVNRLLTFPNPDRDKLTMNREKTTCITDTGAVKMATIAKRELKTPKSIEDIDLPTTN